MTHLVVFQIEDQRFALNLSAVERVLPMVAVSALPNAPQVVLGAINVHGSILPVVDIRRRLGIHARPYGSSTHLVLARTPRRRVAVAADAVLGVTQQPIDNMVASCDVLPNLSDVAGIVPLEDGLLLVQDLDTLLSLDEEQQLTHAIEAFDKVVDHAVA